MASALRRSFAGIAFVLCCTTVDGATIDTITGAANTHYNPNEPGFSNILLFGLLVEHALSDGTSLVGGISTYSVGNAVLDTEEIVGSAIRYTLSPLNSGLLLNEVADTDPATQSTNGTIIAQGPLVIEAQVGSGTGTLSGFAKVQSNTPTGDPNFVPYSAPVGAIVPFTASYSLVGNTWHSGIFSEQFNYLLGARIDLAHPVPEQYTLALLGAGLGLLLAISRVRARRTLA